MSDTRIETSRVVAAPAAEVFAVLCDPHGHVAIDSSGHAAGRRRARWSRPPATRSSVHMDRESLNDYPEMGRYDVTVTIGDDFEPDRHDLLDDPRAASARRSATSSATTSSRTTTGGTVVTSYYDWSDIHPDWAAMGIFPVLSENALRAHARHPRPHRAARLRAALRAVRVDWPPCGRCASPTATPVRAASALARLGDGWLVAQDDATHGCLVAPTARHAAVRLLPAGRRARPLRRGRRAPSTSSPTSRPRARCRRRGAAAGLGLDAGPDALRSCVRRRR